jgi:hypothetical protein
MTTARPPGWYDDPGNSTAERYWNKGGPTTQLRRKNSRPTASSQANRQPPPPSGFPLLVAQRPLLTPAPAQPPPPIARQPPPPPPVLQRPPPPAPSRQMGSDALALGLCLVGAITIVVSTFLPFEESADYDAIEENTLVQHGYWILIPFGIVIAATAFWSSRGERPVWTTWRSSPIWWCVSAGLTVLRAATNKSLRVLEPADGDGGYSLAHLGIAVYVAGAGTVIAFVGALLLYLNARGAKQAPAITSPPAWTPAVPAAWYPDPNNSTLQRYWDGTNWTDSTATLR